MMNTKKIRNVELFNQSLSYIDFTEYDWEKFQFYLKRMEKNLVDFYKSELAIEHLTSAINELKDKKSWECNVCGLAILPFNSMDVMRAHINFTLHVSSLYYCPDVYELAFILSFMNAQMEKEIEEECLCGEK